MWKTYVTAKFLSYGLYISLSSPLKRCERSKTFTKVLKTLTHSIDISKSQCFNDIEQIIVIIVDILDYDSSDSSS